LYGPPGCGKTHLARATAGQINASFMSIGIHDVLDMWSGNSEKRLHEIFDLARRQTPCVLFFDEIDALGASRSDMRHSATKMLINQFLTELDGISASNDGVLILGATNAPWHLDTAFRRPGRFDRIIFVQPPDQESRESIFKITLKDKPTQQIDYPNLAKITSDFSGADIKAVVDITIEDKLRQSFQQGKPEPIFTKDLQAAVKKVKPSTKEWFNTARNYALYANDSGLYDEILEYLKIKK
jgi:SpoVK/Ycf46/Vps4 family AAA+-type ATPase